MTQIDRTNAGRRVELIHTDDPYTSLKPGSRGTYEFRLGEQHSIKWDDGSSLMLIEGKDRFKFEVTVAVDFFEALAVMSVEEEYPKETKRLDELHEKEKAGEITDEEQKALDRLDRRLMAEHQRCETHYRLNWPFMKADVKAKYRERVDAWKEKMRNA